MDNSFAIDLLMDGFDPGFYDLTVRVKITGTKTITGYTTFGWRWEQQPAIALQPPDFLPFWQQAREKLHRRPLDLRWGKQGSLAGEEIGRYNRAQAALPEHYDPEGERCSEVEVYKVDFAASQHGRVYGWLAKPVGAGPFPGMLVLPGGGTGPRPAPVEHARHGYAALDIQVHGFPVDAGAYPPLPEHTYTTPEQYDYYAIYLNVLQAVTALSELPGVDAGRLTAAGGSQGGRLSLVAAALDSRIRAAIPAITHNAYLPWLHWTERLNKAKTSGREGFGVEDVVVDTKAHVESYYDVLNFAPLMRCPVLMNAGLIDPVSAPTAVFAAYQSITSPKEMIALPNLAHDWSPAFDRYAWKWLANVLDS